MVCAVGDEDGTIIDRITFPTRQPKETFADMIGYFKAWDIEALGIGCFGPVDLNRQSETYGYITETPKKGWENCNIVGTFKDALGIPVGFDTDVRRPRNLGRYQTGDACRMSRGEKDVKIDE